MGAGKSGFPSRMQAWAQRGLRVVRPGATDVWLAGRVEEIRWRQWGQLAPRVHIGLVPAFGQGRTRPIALGVPNSGSYTWNIPAALRSGLYRVGVATADLRVDDLSETFRIKHRPSVAIAIGAGERSSYAVLQGGTLVGWGINGTIGYLGDGALLGSSPKPLIVAGLAGMVQVSAASGYVLALDGNGDVWSWGRNTYGNLGDGTTTDRATPVRVQNLSGVTAVAAGTEALALRNDGTVWSWGYGQAGVIIRSTPAQLAGLSNVSAIAAGQSHGLALDTGGAIWAWGRNLKGQLGNGAASSGYTAPARVPGLASARGIAAGITHSVALLADGTVWAWGSNNSGELGNGLAFTEAPTPVPGQVPGITEMRAVAAAGFMTFAIGNDDGLWGWGWNQDGQFGTGATSGAAQPARIREGVRAVSAGYRHCLFLLLSGEVLASGWNDNGQLGDETLVSRPRAEPVHL